MTRLTLSLLVLLMAWPAWAQNFEILNATYGTIFQNVDVTDKVRSLVRGAGVEFTLDGSALDDPFPGVEKTLNIRYSIRGRARNAQFKDGQVVKLGNPTSAWTGGDGNTNPQGNDLVIHAARYGDGRRWIDVTPLLRNNIRQNSLRMAVTNQTMGGDPAPAVNKFLEVDYTANRQRGTQRIAEGETLQLVGSYFGGSPGPGWGNAGGSNTGGGRLEIISARYGTLGTNIDVLDQLRRRIQGGRLRIDINPNMLGGDPSGRRLNEILVEYTLNGQTMTRVARDGETLNLP